MKVYELFSRFEERKAIGGYPPAIDQCVSVEALEEYEKGLERAIAILGVIKEHAVVNSISEGYFVCAVKKTADHRLDVSVCREIFVHPKEGGLEGIIERAKEEKLRAEIRRKELELSLAPEEEEQVWFALGQ